MNPHIPPLPDADAPGSQHPDDDRRTPDVGYDPRSEMAGSDEDDAPIVAESGTNPAESHGNAPDELVEPPVAVAGEDTPTPAPSAPPEPRESTECAESPDARDRREARRFTPHPPNAPQRNQPPFRPQNQRPPAPRPPVPSRQQVPFQPAPAAAVSHAIEEITRIVDALRSAFEQMEEVLELVEIAERQKLADEREIDSLRRALRQFQNFNPRNQRREEPADHSHEHGGDQGGDRR